MIGIIGGYGAVGRQAAGLLHAWRSGPLRIGGRDLTAAHQAAARLTAAPLSAARLGGPVEAVAVDLDDDASLTAFAHGCTVLVNCAGPSAPGTARVVRAALAAGAHLVDAGGSALPSSDGDRSGDRDSDRSGDRSAVFAAGALPGLSGLLPRWLAGRGFDAVHQLTAYAGVLDRFTPTGAAGFLAEVLDGVSEPLAAWQDGARSSGALTRRTALRLPCFPREVSALPYLDEEGEQLAKELSLVGGRWYTVLDGEHLGTALDAARAMERPAAIAGLCRASALDAAGRTPYVTLLVQLDGVQHDGVQLDGVQHDGTAAGRTITRTAVLRSPGVAQLTGAVTAAAVEAVLSGEVPPGSHLAATVLDPVRTLARLRSVPAACELAVFDLTLDQLTTEEEGEL